MRLAIVLFAAVLFVSAYFLFIHVHLPVRDGGENQVTLYSFTLYNYLPKLAWYAIKLPLLFLILKLSFFIANAEIKFGQTMGAIILSELVFFIPDFIQIYWFSFIQTEYTMKDIYGLLADTSLAGILNVGHKELSYPFLYLINIFEMLYVFILSYFVAKRNEISLDKSFVVILIGYGIVLVLWALVSGALNMYFS